MLTDRSLPNHGSPATFSRRLVSDDNVFEEAGHPPPSPRSGPMPGIILTVEGEEEHHHHAEAVGGSPERSARSTRSSRRSRQPYANSIRASQRSPSASSMRRNASSNKLREPVMNGGSGVSRSQSMRTSRRPQSVDPNYRFRHRIASIPNDMILPSELLNPERVDSNQSLPLPTDEEVLRLRNFAITPKGVVNRGDSFRSKSRSTHSVSSMSSGHHTPVHRIASDSASRPIFPEDIFPQRTSDDVAKSKPSSPEPVGAVALELPVRKTVKYRVLVLGCPDVGKSSLTQQFTTSEYICSYEESIDEENEKSVTVILNGEESELVFAEHTFLDDSSVNLSAHYNPDAYLVVYSVTNKRSLQVARDIVRLIHKWDAQIDNKALILVGNKMDLARLRILTIDDGRGVAIEEGCKFIETSAGINHHVDELLVGILTQIRLKLSSADRLLRKRESVSLGPSGRSKAPNKCAGCAGCRAKGILKRILKKACNRSKSCDNLHVL